MMSLDAFTPAATGQLTGADGDFALLLDRLDLAWNAHRAGHDLPDAVAEILEIALEEVLDGVTRHAGPQAEADGSAVDLWVEPCLIVLCIRFRGAPLPGWLVDNWDRGSPPGRLTGERRGWQGWLSVREAFDSVCHGWRGSEQQIFLERRL